MKLTPIDPMPFGKHKGVAMAQVPAEYLMWLHENGKCSREVAIYIEDHKSELRQLAREERKEYFDARMPFGGYKGELLADIPSEYLIACYESDKCPRNVREYVEENMTTIRANAEKSAANRAALKSMY